jgi:ubiquinone/menaquinone biosynthesis C-methylase UbiE
MAKDLFSGHAKLYAQFRPTYPQELFNYILQFVEGKNCAWDCATGNGQAAIVLANYFKKVEASDISEAQINNALQKNNISYHVCPAEKTLFAGNSFDLITVAQAYHWIDWQKFHDEATRVGKNGCVVTVWGYNIFSSDDDRVNQLIHHFYYDIVYRYWDAERRHVENNYESVNFDFELLPSKTFSTDLVYKKEHFIGYLQSWSAVQHYIKSNNSSPIDLIKNDIDSVWKKDETKGFHFPIFLKLGRIVK